MFTKRNWIRHQNLAFQYGFKQTLLVKQKVKKVLREQHKFLGGMWTHNHVSKDFGAVIDTHEKKSKQWKRLSFVTLALVSEETFAVPFADSFEIHNSRKMKRTFKVSILVLVSHGQSIVYLKSSLESPVQGKWKGFSTVILALASEQKFTFFFDDLCESPIQGKWKGLPTVTSKLNCRS